MISLGITYDFFPEGYDREFISEILGDDATEEQILEMLKAIVLENITTAINEQDPDLLQVEVKDLNV
jgi:hypothetical protein